MKSLLRSFRSTQPPFIHYDQPTTAIENHKRTTGKTLVQSRTTSQLTVIELFQSQGCNSCPPANANLLNLPSTSPPDTIFLAYNVTYWDHLGWRDTFGSNASDQRQRDYVRRLELKSAFTPQVIVNGQASGVGNTRSGLEKVLDEGGAGKGFPIWVEAVRGGLVVGEKDVAVTVLGQGSEASDRDLEVWAILYDPSTVYVPVTSGENKNEVLPHRNVVKSMKKLGIVKQGQDGIFALRKEHDGLEAVVLVQDGIGGSVLGAAIVD